MFEFSADAADGDRLAKVIARSGLCSRRDAEGWIKDGRVTVNGKKVLTPAFNVSEKDKIRVDGEPLAARQGTRVWLYHKPPGLVVTEKDPEGRETVFEKLAEQDLPRVVSIGRLDINTEGLLLLTNDGGLKRVLELPATGWLRRYRVRAFGTVTQPQLDALKDGIEIDGVQYGSIDAQLERSQGSNVWLVLALREGKNREVKNVLGALGLQVNRLIRVSFGPFQLGDLAPGAVETVAARVLREQLGKRLAELSGADFESEMPEVAAQKKEPTNPRLRAAAPGEELKKASPRRTQPRQFRFEDDESAANAERARTERPRKDRPGRGDARPQAARTARPDAEFDVRKVHFDDGTEGEVRLKPKREPRPDGRFDADDSSARNYGRPAHHEDGPRKPGPRRTDATDAPRPPRKPFADKKPFGDKRSFGDKKPFGERKTFGDKTSFGDKKSFGGKKPFSPGDKPFRPRPDGDRPARNDGAPRPFRRDDADRPERKSFGKTPFAPRDGADRPAGAAKPFRPRADGDRPERKGFGKKPYAPRDSADRPARAHPEGKPFGDRKPYGAGPGGGKPFAGKPGGSRPAGGKPFGTRPGGGRPFGGKPSAGKPAGDRPRGGKPAGDRPRGPRTPRS